MIKAEKRTFKMGAYLTDVDHVFITSTDCNPEDWVPLIEQEFEIDIPEVTDKEISEGLIEGLEAKRERIEQDAFNEVTKINDEIQKLRALTHIEA